MDIEDNLKSLGIVLPQISLPVANYLLYTISGDCLYLSGHIAKKDGKVFTGKLGADLQVEDGQLAASLVAIDMLGTLKYALGDLNKIKQVLKINCLVNSAHDFNLQHLVANGASDLLVKVLGDKGKHARAAYGVAALPNGTCVEIDLVASIVV